MKKTHATHEDTSELRVLEFVHVTSYFFHVFVSTALNFSLIYPSFTYLGLTYSVWLHSDSFSSMRLCGLMELKWEPLSLLIEAFGNFVQLPDKDHNLPGPDQVIPGLPGLQSCVSHTSSSWVCVPAAPKNPLVPCPILCWDVSPFPCVSMELPLLIHL